MVGVVPLLEAEGASRIRMGELEAVWLWGWLLAAAATAAAWMMAPMEEAERETPMGPLVANESGGGGKQVVAAFE